MKIFERVIWSKFITINLDNSRHSPSENQNSPEVEHFQRWLEKEKFISKRISARVKMLESIISNNCIRIDIFTTKIFPATDIWHSVIPK